MGCKLKEGTCKGFELGYRHCDKGCLNYEELMAKTNISDYEQWKQWLDKWNVSYREERWTQNTKELIVDSNWAVASIVFDLDDKFICMAAYE